jgi:hypothetical protein
MESQRQRSARYREAIVASATQAPAQEVSDEEVNRHLREELARRRDRTGRNRSQHTGRLSGQS